MTQILVEIKHLTLQNSNLNEMLLSDMDSYTKMLCMFDFTKAVIFLPRVTSKSSTFESVLHRSIHLATYE